MTSLPTAGARILIVDDQETNVAVLTALLYQAGYTEIKGVTDSRTAAAAFLEFVPDLVLLDLVMPHLDGHGVMAQLRPLIPEGSFLPILVLTAEITPEVKRRALADGASDFLSKPLDTTEVRLRIRNLLQTRLLHQRLQEQNERLEALVQQRTAELEEARGQILELYRELANRNHDLHGLVLRLLQAPGESAGRAAQAAREAAAGSAAVERLTGREQEVLRCVAQGQTNAEIARSLVVSVGTVKTHVEHIIAKLGVADRTQAAVKAVELGFLAAPVRPTERAHAVFVSYAHEDAVTVSAIVAALEAGGVPCWLAPRDIAPGADYAAAIVSAIQQSRAVMVVFSAAANRSPHVRRELERATSLDRPIIPVRLDATVPSQSLEYFLSTSHWLTAFPDPIEPYLPNLVATARSHAGAR